MTNKTIISLFLCIFSMSASIVFGQADEPSIIYKQLILDNGLITLAIPEMWDVDIDNATTQSIGIASNPNVLARDTNTPLTGEQATVLLNFIDTASASENDYIVGETLLEKLDFAINSMSESIVDENGDTLITFREPEYIAGTSLTWAYAQVTYSFEDTELTLIMWDISDGLLGIALVQTADDAREQNMEIAINIVQSIRYLGDAYDVINREVES